MFDLPGLKRETRYGMPAADQIIINRHYTIGYSYYFRQAKWALEIVGRRAPPRAAQPSSPLALWSSGCSHLVVWPVTS